jgi:2-polyprenyl-3-methyl-5-hydroxy-6-metoxy-1,4-benzoquinol methylase
MRVPDSVAGDYDARDEVGNANRERYVDARKVEGYLGEQNHALRVRLAVESLDAALRSRPAPEDRERGLRVLELGGASGLVAAMVREKGYDVVVSDCEPRALLMARQRALRCVAFDVRATFPMRSGTFDGILMGELIEHMFEPMHVLEECWRVLRGDGVLVLTTPNLAILQDRVRFLLGKSPRQVDVLHEYRKLHIRPFTLDSLRRVLSASGFSVSTVHSNYVQWVLWPGARLRSRWLARIMPSLGGSLVVTAKRVI